ncbi:MAG: PAS domain S-box protein [Acidobacteria bacterium]|nr:MAG: PAS domain S-box protein [Acidobacteriota bacterium]RPJ77323.1 MAG: PAS domain S-box protein [Acidobacteriota bacterium]
MKSIGSILAGSAVHGTPRQVAVGVVSAVLATAVRMILAPLLTTSSSYLGYTLAVVVATWLGGAVAGATALGLGALAGTYLFADPYFALQVALPDMLVTVVFFVAVSAGLMWVVLRSIRAEAALRRSEERLSLALSAGRQAPWEVDVLSGEVLDSPALREIFGVPEGDAVRTTADWRRFVLPEDQPAIERALAQALQGTGEYRAEYRVRRATDGEVRWVTSRGRAQRDDGTFRRLVGFASDITVRKWAEEALRESERRLRRIVEHIHDGLIIDDRQGRVVFANDRFLAMFGFDRSRLESLTIQDYAAPEHREALLDRHRRRVAGESVPEHFEYAGLRADGARLWIEVDVVAVVDDRGDILGTQSAMRDVTERRRAEQALADSEERLRIALAAARGGGYIYDLRTMRLSVSPEAAQVYGFPAGVVSKAEAVARVLPEDRAKLERALERAVTGNGEYQVDYRVRLADGSTRSLASFGRVQAENQRLVGCVIDVTERALLAEELRRKASELEEAGRLKDEFIATVSHELRTPLNAMLGWAELLRERRLESPAAQDRAYAAIANNARRQAQLIEDLLDMSRIVAGKVRLEPRVTDPASVVQAAIEAVLPSAEAKAITIEVDVRSGRFMVLADPARLQQIAWNLLSNAVKFTPSGGRVWVALGRQEGEVELSVRDNGIGIRREFLPYVFDRFRQGDGDTTRAQGGLGLGLSIVRHLAEAQGGRVYASSPGEGLGATFAVLLPHADLAERREPARPQSILPHRAPLASLPPGAAVPNLCGAGVLVVDDDMDARELTATVLSRHGASVTTADGAAAALRALEKQPPDVVVLDIAMPGTDGYGLLRRIREGNGPSAAVPAVALTAYAREEDRRRAIAAGFSAHLSKPVDAAELVRAIADARQGTGPAAG